MPRTIVYNRQLIEGFESSDFSIEEISGLTGIPEPDLYKIASGIINAGEEAKRRIAAILNRSVDDIFPPEKNRKDAV
jgi:hypothetical protein